MNKPRFTKGSTFKSGKYYYFKTRDTVTGKQIKRCTYQKNKRNLTAAVNRILAELHANIGQPVKTRKGKISTVAEMLETFYNEHFVPNISNRLPEKQAKQKSNIKAQFNHLNKHLGHINPLDLNIKTINTYIKNRRKDRKVNGQSYADGSIKLEIAFLKSAVKILGNDRFKVKKNIGVFGDYLELEQIERKVTLSPEELKAISEKFAQYDIEHKHRTNFLFFIELLYFFGIRWGQLRLLEYDEINLRPNVCRLEFPPQKTKHEKSHKHMVYFDHVIRAQLKKAMNSNDIDHTECRCSKSKDCKIKKSSYVFPNEHRRCKPFDTSTFYNVWKMFCEDLGYVKHDKYKKNELEYLVLPHDVRRTRIFSLIRQGWDRKFIMNQTGHRSHKTFDQYIKDSPEIMLEVVNQFRDKEVELALKDKQIKKSADEIEQEEKEKIWG